jgi:hypothetical protein
LPRPNSGFDVEQSRAISQKRACERSLDDVLEVDFGTTSSESALDVTSFIPSLTLKAIATPRSANTSRTSQSRFIAHGVFPGLWSIRRFPSYMEFARLSEQNKSGLDLLTEVGTQCERAVIVQFLLASPPHGIAHSLYLNLRSKFQSFPIYDVWKHELCLPNPAR